MLMLAMAAMEKGAVPDWDVVFLLEEFAALGHLEVIEKAAGLMPGYGLKLWVILQDLTQLQSLYRDSWETFLDNAGAIQAFGNDGLTTTKYLSERIGEKEYKIMEDAKLGTQALLGAGATMIERRQRAQLIPPYEIGRAFARESETRAMLLLRKGAPPAVISRFPYDWSA
jgi:type IV secretion system protein VirD4